MADSNLLLSRLVANNNRCNAFNNWVSYSKDVLMKNNFKNVSLITALSTKSFMHNGFEVWSCYKYNKLGLLP